MSATLNATNGDKEQTVMESIRIEIMPSEHLTLKKDWDDDSKTFFNNRTISVTDMNLYKDSELPVFIHKKYEIFIAWYRQNAVFTTFIQNMICAYISNYYYISNYRVQNSWDE